MVLFRRSSYQVALKIADIGRRDNTSVLMIRCTIYVDSSLIIEKRGYLYAKFITCALRCSFIIMNASRLVDFSFVQIVRLTVDTPITHRAFKR